MLNRLFNPARLDEYRRYRMASMALHEKIMKAFVDSDRIGLAARALNLGGKNRQLVFDTEEDINMLMDYALYELRQDGKSLVELYQAQKGESDPIEGELLSAMVKARLGLFRVDSVLRSSRQVRLSSLLESERGFKLTDINLSETVFEGIILCIRPLELPKFTIGSGITFSYPATMATELVERWQREPTSARRYATMFKLSKRKGYTVGSADLRAGR